MNSAWETFLQNNGAEFDGGQTVVSFGSLRRELSMALTGTVFADLSQLGILAVRGKDAATFLQGQCTNDVVNLAESHSQLNGICSPKGRFLATFRVFRDGEGYLLSMPRQMLEGVAKRLQMFIMRSAVILTDASDQSIRLGVSGPAAMTELSALISSLPSAVDEVVRSGEYTVVQIPGVQPRFEVHGPIAAMQKLWETLNVRAAPVGTSAWQLLDILAGLPVITPETTDAFVPQMVNYQLIGGVSFKKGCYTGQEVVARMQYLGKLKRQMYLAKIQSDAAPQPGNDLYSPADKEQSAGKIVSAEPHPDGGYMVLAVIQIASQEAGPLHLGSSEGPVLEFAELPYALATPA
ncbi:MAG: folate-binding protein [Gammaproteobacteria bacterium]|nr:folate-binding protein [Gammaproteobacteria bacterium]